jgi:pyroglutamyl-peptidase
VTDSTSPRLIFAALAGLLAVAATAVLTGCGAPDATPDDPNAGLLRDFLDGKFDGDGHPLNAVTTQASLICPSGAAPCKGAVGGGAQQGDLQINARIQVTQHKASGNVATFKVLDASGKVLASDTLTVTRIRNTSGWIDLPLSWTSDGSAITVQLTAATGSKISVDYFEVFPTRFGLVASPGSGVIGDDDHLTLEIPRYGKITKLEIDGVDSTAALQALVDDGVATSTTTNFRTVIDVAVGDLVPDRGDVADVMIHAADQAARLQLRRTASTCNYEGTGAKKVLLTGFQPFPADESHGNVSGEAVLAMQPAHIKGAQVMRLVLPVEYDRASAEVVDAIARCQPDIVISFGQGGDEIALEETAYNLQDTGEVSGGVPDNRGIVRAAQPIDEAAPATRATLLPLDAIEAAMVAIGEAPAHSTDPGRYICNNVMFGDIGAMTGKRAGFIHLPYTTEFPDDVKLRFGNVVEAAVQATVDAK